MGIEGASRNVVIDVIQQAAATLREGKARPDDTMAVAKALATACGALGLAPERFDAAVAADPDLEQLKALALKEAVAGSTDPGPHDAISREAATGVPGDTAQGPGAPGHQPGDARS